MRAGSRLTRLLGATSFVFALAGCTSASLPVSEAASRPVEPGSAQDAAGLEADIVLRGGPIYTLDAARSWARALAIDEGVLVYVGSERGVAAFVGPETQVVELGGRFVMPSFQDIHIHPIYAGTEMAIFCDLSGVATEQAYLEEIGRYAAAHPEAEWIRGGGWVMNAFPGGIPDGRKIDGVVPDRPVYLGSADGHSAWVNSKALQLAGITSDTPDPPDGRIDRDPLTGAPVGALQEGAMGLVELPEVKPQQRAEGLRYALKLLNGLGITALQDASVVPGELETYRTLDAKGELTARVVASQWWERSQGEEQIGGLVERRRAFTKGRVNAGTVKIMQDGVMENHTAAMLEPYVGLDGERGIPFIEPEALARIVTRLDAEGFQVHFHAIGDAAIRQSLDAVEAARVANGDGGGRHHISHLQLIDPADVPRFRELGVVANFQPLWAYADEYITDLTVPFLGPERSRWIYPIGSVVRSGGVVAFGSDWNVSSPNPFEQIEVAITRLGPDGETGTPLTPEQRIDLPTSLAAFTINAAYVNGIEDRTGSLEVGKLADLVVVDRDPFAVEPAELSELVVELTLLEGRVVHGTLPGEGLAAGSGAPMLEASLD